MLNIKSQINQPLKFLKMTLKKDSAKLKNKIKELNSLILSLQNKSTTKEKLSLLNELKIVKDFLAKPSPINTYLSQLNPEQQFVIKSIIAIDQGPIVFNVIGLQNDLNDSLDLLVKQLAEVENFYQEIGGIIGYHTTILKLLSNISEESKPELQAESIQYLFPNGIRIDIDSPELRKAIKIGLENLPHVAEIYPIGGAGDRLNLSDPITGVPLPAAMLPFNGRSLLEELIMDVQAREYLYFKLYNRQITTPIAMMTSSEKNNHHHILSIFLENKWFGRPEKSFFFFMQPLVPVITVEGNWSLYEPLKLTLKPGGHGVIWKLAQEHGLFTWLFEQGYDKSIIRQINNPVSGLDHALVSLIGFGSQENRSMGFISCERLPNAAEGTNVLIEKKTDQGYEYCITNIEYTDLSKKHISDDKLKFPANTNILFVNLHEILNALKQCTLPGKLINMKTKVPYRDKKGEMTTIEGGRLETIMQNIADRFIYQSPKKLNKQEIINQLKTFVIYNRRDKTISTTKKSYKVGESPIATPEQAFYDILVNHRILLESHCQFKVPKLNSLEEYIENGPTFLFYYHPALGPFYSIIAQKIRKGRIAKHSELHLDVAEADIYELELDGSIYVEALSPMGYRNEMGVLIYGKESRCHLHHVKVKNEGIDFHAKNSFWKNQVHRHESLKILLHEGAEFSADHVTFHGNHFYEVPAYHRMEVLQDKEGKLEVRLDKITKPSWNWEYAYDKDDNVKLRRSNTYLSKFNHR